MVVFTTDKALRRALKAADDGQIVEYYPATEEDVAAGVKG